MGLFNKPNETFGGRNIGTAPGTHAAIVSMITRHLTPRGAVLDIGAHSGALLSRLKEVGFSELMGTDLDITLFDVPGAEFKRLELNQSFACEIKRKFQLVASTDVIEHLDSPRSFLKEVRSLLADDGWLVISLPNVASWEGRITFFLFGELWQFRETNYRTQRHISPITSEQMVMMLQELGFEVVEMRAAGSFSTSLKKALTFPLWAFAGLLRGFPVFGSSAIFLAKKAVPNAELKRPIHYRERWGKSQAGARDPQAVS